MPRDICSGTEYKCCFSHHSRCCFQARQLERGLLAEASPDKPGQQVSQPELPDRDTVAVRACFALAQYIGFGLKMPTPMRPHGPFARFLERLEPVDVTVEELDTNE